MSTIHQASAFSQVAPGVSWSLHAKRYHDRRRRGIRLTTPNRYGIFTFRNDLFTGCADHMQVAIFQLEAHNLRFAGLQMNTLESAALHGQRGSCRLGFGKLMVTKDVDDCVAIGNYVALKTPLAAQLILEQKLVGAGRLPVDAVIGAHHRLDTGWKMDPGEFRLANTGASSPLPIPR